MTHLSQIADKEERIAAECAMVFLGTHGSTCYAPECWTFVRADERGKGSEGSYRFAESNYAPEWLSESDLDCERDQCVTVLSYGFSQPQVPAGYRIAYQYQAGEQECPWCSDQSQEAKDAGAPDRATCELCEQSGYIYDGEDCTVVVFAPRYTYGSGMLGCLYDNGPHAATSVDEAIEALVSDFDSYFETLADTENDAIGTVDEAGAIDPETEEKLMRKTLATDGIFYFSKPSLAGAHYCEITDHGTGE